MGRVRLRLRRLVAEQLESRQMLAADLQCLQNFVMPEDVDSNGLVAPADALHVINFLNSRRSGMTSVPEGKLLDVNGDGSVTPSDVLTIINSLNRHLSGDMRNVASLVPVAKRIGAIEAALASDHLPNGMTADRARHLLSTLKAGGRPELGESALGGRIVVDDVLANVDEKLDRLEKHLASLGVGQDQIDGAIAAIRDDLEAGNGELRDLVELHLRESGIHFQELIESKCESAVIERLPSILERLGVDSELARRVASRTQEILDGGESNIRAAIATALSEHELSLQELVQQQTVDRMLDALEQRLVRIGLVEAEAAALVEKIRADLLASPDLNPREWIRQTLSDGGIDLGKLVVKREREALWNQIAERLRALGAESDQVTALLRDIRNGSESGRPLAWNAIAERVLQLGIDPRRVLPGLPNGSQNNLDVDPRRLMTLIRELDIRPAVLERIVREVINFVQINRRIGVSDLVGIMSDAGLPTATIREIVQRLLRR